MLRLTNASTDLETNVMIQKIVHFQPSTDLEGATAVRLSTGDFIHVKESCRTLRSQIKKASKGDALDF